MEARELLEEGIGKSYYINSIGDFVCIALLLDVLDDGICIMENNGVMRKVHISRIIKQAR